MTLDHMVDRIYWEAGRGSMGCPVEGSLSTGSMTINRGINSEVTNSGIVSVAQSREANTKMARQFFCNTFCKGEKKSNRIKMTVMRINLNIVG